MDLFYAEVSRETKLGAPPDFPYPVMIIAFFIP